MTNTTESMVTQDDRDAASSGVSTEEIVAVLESMIPTNMSLNNPRWPDSTVVPIEATMGELRAIAAILSRLGAQS